MLLTIQRVRQQKILSSRRLRFYSVLQPVTEQWLMCCCVATSCWLRFDLVSQKKKFFISKRPLFLSEVINGKPKNVSLSSNTLPYCRQPICGEVQTNLVQRIPSPLSFLCASSHSSLVAYDGYIGSVCGYDGWTSLLCAVTLCRVVFLTCCLLR